MSTHRASRRRSHLPQAGFTVIEMVVTLTILVAVLTGVLALFSMASKVGRNQVDIADMQQSGRQGQYEIVRMLRQAGRGGVPAEQAQPALPAVAPTFSLPNGIAVAVSNNVAANTFIDAQTKKYPVLAGTDILTVRGVITQPVYTIVAGTFVLNSGDPAAGNNGGSMTISNNSNQLTQNLQPLIDAINAGRPESLILVGDQDDAQYQFVQLDPAGSVVNATTVQLAFRIGPIGGVANPSPVTADWMMSPCAVPGLLTSCVSNTWDSRITNVKSVGIVEEYKYYVEDIREVPGDATSPSKPRLARARVYPGTQQPWAGTLANWEVPIADNVADLQVALGIESGGLSPFTLDEGQPPNYRDGAGDPTDEWLYNNTGDDATNNKWRFGKLRYIRITTTAFSDRRDQSYQAPATMTTEDHTYSIPTFGTLSANSPDQMYRRRSLRTLVDPRSL